MAADQASYEVLAACRVTSMVGLVRRRCRCADALSQASTMVPWLGRQTTEIEDDGNPEDDA